MSFFFQLIISPRFYSGREPCALTVLLSLVTDLFTPRLTFSANSHPRSRTPSPRESCGVLTEADIFTSSFLHPFDSVNAPFLFPGKGEPCRPRPFSPLPSTPRFVFRVRSTSRPPRLFFLSPLCLLLSARYRRSRSDLAIVNFRSYREFGLVNVFG